MNHLKLYENYNRKPVILYLHGLDGNLGKTKMLFNQIDVQYVGISTDYRLGSIWHTISDMKIDGVVGHSMGAYLAYFISNLKKIPCLMFMPCFDDEMFEIQPIPDVIKSLPMYPEKISIIGDLDNDVDKSKQMHYIKDTEVHQHNMYHDLTTDVYYKYCKLFIDRYFRGEYYGI